MLVVPAIRGMKDISRFWNSMFLSCWS